MEWMFMPLKRYAEFSGRSRRMEYWMFVLFQILIGVAFWILMAAIGGAALMNSGDPAALMTAGGGVVILFCLYGLVSLALFIPALAVAVRRLHDTDRSGWWILAPVVPYVLVFVGAGMAMSSPDNPGLGGMLSMIGVVAVIGLGLTVLVFMLLEGTRGANRFGPDPKERAPGDAAA